MDTSSRSLTFDQERALDVMRSGANVFLTGLAGTGKSFLVSEFSRENKDKNVVICDSSGECGDTSGGDSLHSTFGIPMGILKVGDYNEKPKKALEKADIIIIDDISACRIDVFDYAIETLKGIARRKEAAGDKEHLHKQVVLVGDFYKAPPVVKGADRRLFLTEWGLLRGEDLYAFNSSLWDELELENIILKAPVSRISDQDYLDKLYRVNSHEEDTDDTDSIRTTRVVYDFYGYIHDELDYKPGAESFREVRKGTTPVVFSAGKISASDYEEWTDDEDDRLLEEWAEGVRINDIAKRHDRTVGAIRVRLNSVSFQR